MAIEKYNIRVSDELYPLGFRVVRNPESNLITLTYEYLLKGVDSRDLENELVPLDQLYDRVFIIDDLIQNHPSDVMQAIGIISSYLEEGAKEVEFPEEEPLP